MNIDLEKFTGNCSIRTWLNKPFNFEGSTIATNGHILIALPQQEGHEPLEASKEKYVKSVLEQIKIAEEYQPIPEYNLPDTDCPECKGTLKQDSCRECNNKGTVELDGFYNDYTVDCKSCDGGNFDGVCQWCAGTGYKNATAYVNLGNGFWINGTSYLPMIKKLPNVKICLKGKPTEIIPFRFDGGFGAAMPLKPQHAPKTK